MTDWNARALCCQSCSCFNRSRHSCCNRVIVVYGLLATLSFPNNLGACVTVSASFIDLPNQNLHMPPSLRREAIIPLHGCRRRFVQFKIKPPKQVGKRQVQLGIGQIDPQTSPRATGEADHFAFQLVKFVGGDQPAVRVEGRSVREEVVVRVVAVGAVAYIRTWWYGLAAEDCTC